MTRASRARDPSTRSESHMRQRVGATWRRCHASRPGAPRVAAYGIMRAPVALRCLVLPRGDDETCSSAPLRNAARPLGFPYASLRGAARPLRSPALRWAQHGACVASGRCAAPRDFSARPRDGSRGHARPVKSRRRWDAPRPALQRARLGPSRLVVVEALDVVGRVGLARQRAKRPLVPVLVGHLLPGLARVPAGILHPRDVVG